MTLTRTILCCTMFAVVATPACRDGAGADGDTAIAGSAEIPNARGAAARGDTIAHHDTAWVARPASIGRVRTGMTRAELVGVVGQPTRAGYNARERCTYMGGTALPAGMQAMVFDGIVVRIDLMERGVPTLEGAQVGDAESDVVRRYEGRVRVTPHPYTGPTGHYLTVTPPGDTLHRIVFETDGRQITAYRVGRLPQVEWIEGCS